MALMLYLPMKLWDDQTGQRVLHQLFINRRFPSFGVQFLPHTAVAHRYYCASMSGDLDPGVLNTVGRYECRHRNGRIYGSLQVPFWKIFNFWNFAKAGTNSVFRKTSPFRYASWYHCNNAPQRNRSIPMKSNYRTLTWQNTPINNHNHFK